MTRRFRLTLLAAPLLLLTACVSSQVVVDKPPPAPKSEARGKKPSGDVFWKDGHWAWDGGSRHFYWVSGGWAAPREGRIWQNAYWEPIGAGKYRWVPERWDRIQR